MRACDENKFLLGLASGDKWKRIGTIARAGIVVPLFSVYSADSCGIGDLDDLKLLADLCAKTGNSILQLLPMNEVGPAFCPYDSQSSFALEPAYLSLRGIKAIPADVVKRISVCAREFKLPGKTYVDYRIKERKLAILREVFAGLPVEISGDFSAFQKANTYWLDDFALFKALKAAHQEKAWWEWDERFRLRDSGALESFADEHAGEIMFQKWLQWQLCCQFKEAAKYARSKGILVKGDLPILVSRDSADVWAHTELFKLDFDAGAPPDMYCAKGQRWGTPTYEWQKIFDDGGRYLKAKLAYAETFYDLLRIDHVVGLFRIWSIPSAEPAQNAGINGRFDPADESLWEAQGKKIVLFILQNSKLALCAEDLGVIPPQCTRVLAELGIPGNDVQRWAKDWNNRHDFLPPEEYRFLSATMLSTHDTTNWPAWWQYEAGTIDEGLFLRKCGEKGIDPAAARAKLFDPKLSTHGRLRWLESVSSVEIMCQNLGRRKEDCWDFVDLYLNSYHEKEKLWSALAMPGAMKEKSSPALLEAVACRTLRSRSIFCLNLLNDWLYLGDVLKGDPYAYRINTPGTVNERNWSLLVPLALEKLLAHPVCAKIKALNEVACRHTK